MGNSSQRDYFLALVVLQPPPKCFKTEPEHSQGFFICFIYDKESVIKFPTQHFLILKTNYIDRWNDSCSSVFYTLISTSELNYKIIIAPP